MSHVAIPVFSRPFRFVAQHGDFATVEQDSEEDIVQSVGALLSTVIGTRIDLVGYGVRELLYDVNVDTSELLARISEWEPRVTAIIETDRDRLDQMIVNLRVSLGTQGT